MASIFLSYDHRDAARAAPIASALEKLGHSVWWDRHIHGGAQYSKEIERALDGAEAVVVLWSTRSVESAWVRDEATVARDSGRLVPVRIEDTNPPLGFRQFQNVDLVRWKGRPGAAEFQLLLRAIESLPGASERSEPPLSSPARLRSFVSISRPLRFALAVVALLSAAFITFQLTASKSAIPTVAVAAASETSASRNFARELFVKLGNLQAADPQALHLVQQQKGGTAADFIFEVDSSDRGNISVVNLVLLDGEKRSVLWSREFQEPREKQPDLNQQLGYSAARLLACAIEGSAAKIDVATLKLYLSGCASFAESAGGNIENLIPLFREVTTKAPGFESAWRKLIWVQGAMVFGQGMSTDQQLRRQLERDIASARAINPDMPEAFEAEATLLPWNDFGPRMRLLNEAVRRNPRDSFALARRSLELMATGRLREAVRDARRAAALDPLSPITRNSYIYVLGNSGNFDAAIRELNKAERLWPGATNLALTRYHLARRYGDPTEALAMLKSGAAGSENMHIHEPFLRARLEPTSSNVDRAVAAARMAGASADDFLYYVEALGIFGRTEELLSLSLESNPDILKVLFRPAFKELWRDLRLFELGKRIGLVDYWRTSGMWPDFCFEADLPYDCKKEAARLAV